MNVAYFKVYEPFGYNYKRINCTGRWKLESGPLYTNKMFIEHKGVILKEWIPEECIYFLPEEEEIVFECHG